MNTSAENIDNMRGQLNESIADLRRALLSDDMIPTESYISISTRILPRPHGQPFNESVFDISDSAMGPGSTCPLLRPDHIDVHLKGFLIRGIVFMYQALYMMISYASIPCGIWHVTVSHAAHN